MTFTTFVQDVGNTTTKMGVLKLKFCWWIRCLYNHAKHYHADQQVH